MLKRMLLTLLLLLASVSVCLAGPAAPDTMDIEQSDGTKFKAKIHGDEFQGWVEATGSGHTIIRDKESGRWEYAEQEADGTLKSSGIKVDPSGRYAPTFLKKGVKPDRDVVREKEQIERLGRKRESRLAPSFTTGETFGTKSFQVGDWVPARVSGSRQLLVVLVNFANRTLVTTPESWYNAVFDTTPGAKSVANYYSQNSFGNLSVVPAFSEGSHPGVVSVTVPDNHPNCGQNTNYTTETTIISHALAAASASVDLSGFDSATGEVYFIYAGYEASGSAKTPNIWGHAWGGNVTGGSITINNWALNGELNNGGVQHTIGVMTHELGHSLCGLPDLYDTSYTNSGMGAFSLMSGGSWGRTSSETYGGATPVALDAWSREYLGWTAPYTPTADETVTLGAALGAANNAVKLINTSVSGSEYWLAENRHPTPGGWDEGLTGLLYGYSGGMLVTHVDITAGTLGSNDINRYVSGQSQGVVPVQASTSVCNMLASGSANSCRGNAQTTYYSGNNANFTSATTPNSKYYSGALSNRGIASVSARGETMTANVLVTLTADITVPTVSTFTVPALAKTLTVPITSLVAYDNLTVSGYLVTESSTAPSPSATGWSVSAPTSYTFASAGTKKLYAWAKDATGNVSAGKSASLVVDLTAPAVSALAIPASYNSLTVPATLTATDNVTVAGYMVTTDSTAPAASDPNWKTLRTVSIAFSAPGSNTCYAWAKDSAGNVSLSRSATVLVETSAPTVDSFTVDALVAGLAIPIRALSASDTGGSGVAGYRITETSTAPLASATGWSVTPPASYTTGSGGAKTLYAWARDAAGNVSLALTASTFADASIPTVTALTAPAATTNLTIAISVFTATDNVAVAGYLINESSVKPLPSAGGWSGTAPTSYTFASVGIKKIYAWAKDTAGNVSAATMASVVVDQTAPLVSAMAIPASYNSLTVPVTLTATDNTAVVGYLVTTDSTAPAASDTNWKSLRTVSVTFSALGSNTCYAWAKDSAGNVSLSRSAAVLIETAAPTVNSFTVDALVAGLVIPVRALSASDTGGSGVAGYRITETSTAPLASAIGWSVTPPVSYTTNVGGAKTLYAWAKDAAGNVSLARTASTFADASSPTVTALTAPAVTTALTVAVSPFTATDNVAVAGYLINESSVKPLPSAGGWSGTAPTSYTFATAGTKKLYGWAKDTAGNVSAARVVTVVVDQTAPVVTAVAIAASYNSLTVPVTLTVTDNVAVVGYLVTTVSTAPAASDSNWKNVRTLSVTFSAPGSNTCYAWAKDSAGNVSLSRSAAVLIETAAPTVNSFSVDALVAGLAIPVRALSASDTGGSGVAGYRITETSTAPLASATGWSVTPPASYTTGSGGAKTLYAWARDAAGNVSLALTASTFADASIPTVTALTAPAATTNLTIAISVFTATDNVAVAGYLINESSVKPLPSAGGWSGTAPTSYTFATAGSKKLYAWVKDTAGNVSAAKVVSLVVDQTAPLVSAMAIPASYNSLTVPVTLTATDNTAVVGYLVTTDSTAPAASDTNWKSLRTVSVTFSALGSNTCYAWAKDSAGNVSLSRSATVLVETAPPAVASFAVDALVGGLVIPVRALSGSDTGGSGVAGYRITESPIPPLANSTGWSATPPVSYTTGTGGGKVLYAWVKDAAGNVSPARTASVYVDATKPVVFAFMLPSAWTGTTVPVIGYGASDNLAITGFLLTESSTAPSPSATGWSASFPASYTFASTGAKKLYAWAKDSAGNVSVAKLASVTVY